MKTSRTMLLMLGGVLVVLIVAGAVAARMVLEQTSDRAARGDTTRLEASERYESRQFALTGYDTIRMTGGWKVRVSSLAETVEVSFPDNLEPYLIVEVADGLLALELDPKARISGLNRLEAVVPVGATEALETSGAVDLMLEQVDFDRLAIKSSGVLEVRAEGSLADRLTINSSGVADFDFATMPTRTVEVSMSGAGSARLLMDGGSLSGALSGATNVTYEGAASSVDVRTSGASQIRRR